MGLLIERGADIYNETNFQENLMTFASKGGTAFVKRFCF